jgi:hypothetical protein
LKAKFEELCGADLRSLAVLRIGVAVVLILDLCQRAIDLEAHYSDFGLAPRSIVIENMSSRWFASFHFLSGVWQVQAALLVIAAFLALALLVGYRTRFATIGCWVFLISLNVRNPYVLQGGDVLLRVVLFWAMFLPWGAICSIDRAWFGSTSQIPKRIVTWGTVAFAAQIVAVYWFSVLAKSGGEWWREGSAIYYVLSIDYMVTPLGHWLLQLPSALLRLATWTVLGYEIIGPALLFCPWHTGPMRTLAVFGFVVLHCGFLLTLLVGLFPLIGIVSILFFLPSWVWDSLLPRLVVSSEYSSMRSWAERVWYVIAENRLLKHRLSVGRIEEPRRSIQLSSGASVLAAILTLYMLAWNVANLPYSPFKFSDRVRSVGNLVGLDQLWEMFAPFPAKDDGWYVIPGTLKNGRQVDLFRDGAEIDWQKPKYISLTLKNNRWRKFLELLRRKDPLASGYAGYLCRNWNRRHTGSDTLKDLEIVYMIEWTRPNFEYFEPRKMSFLKYQCSTSSAKISPS